ncbi:MAG: lamin tail domain-containing protein, partial [Myxococcota bacterium]
MFWTWISLAFAAPASLSTLSPGDLILTEVMPEPAQVSFYRGQWIEIYNNTGGTVDLDGLIIDDGADTVTISGAVTVAPGDYAVIARRDNPAQNGGIPTVDVRASALRLYRNQTLTLRDADTVFDQVTFTDADFPDSVGSSLSLSTDLRDAAANDSSESWCPASSTYGDGDFGTPGSDNDDCPMPLSSAVVGDLIVTEVMRTTTAVESFRGEWFEIRNNAARSINLNGLQISDDGADILVVAEDL